MNVDGDLFGEEALAARAERRAAPRSRRPSASGSCATCARSSVDAEPHDDMTMVVIKVDERRMSEPAGARPTVEIFRSHSSIEAEVVRGLLDAHGIDAIVSSALSPSVFPVRFGQTEFRVSVPGLAAQKAREIIAGHLDEAAAGEVRRLSETLGPLEAQHRLPLPRPRPARARAHAPIARARRRLGRRDRQRVAGVPRRRRAGLRHRRHAVPALSRPTARATSRRSRRRSSRPRP